MYFTRKRYNTLMAKSRLDMLLFERGMVESRSLAQRMVMAGQVRVNGQVELKPSYFVDLASELTIEKRPRFVSRGGEKLEAALNVFTMNVKGFVCADVGSSTGGFTDCLLQHVVSKVYAIDVGKGILHWKLRQDPRIVVLEETNARHLLKLPEKVDLVTMDVSFISLKVLLPVVKGWLAELPGAKEGEKGEDSGGIISLIKPQFEAGRQETARHKGVIRDPAIHQKILVDLLSFAKELGFDVKGITASPVLGPKGNREFLAWLGHGGPRIGNLKKAVEESITPK
jgi:23S rRNA (cytidine1920-2'-O)/16S rRNA (cytidine1409-2'-O)-methyltransferase